MLQRGQNLLVKWVLARLFALACLRGSCSPLPATVAPTIALSLLPFYFLACFALLFCCSIAFLDPFAGMAFRSFTLCLDVFKARSVVLIENVIDDVTDPLRKFGSEFEVLGLKPIQDLLPIRPFVSGNVAGHFEDIEVSSEPVGLGLAVGRTQLRLCQFLSDGIPVSC